MISPSQPVEWAKESLRTDSTWKRVGRLTKKGAKALPEAAGQYALDKAPIIGWLPRYNYRWILNDVIAGLTLGLMLIPQGLSYAKIADIPVEYGLMSSWLPATIYAVMGTTKDLSTGPTSLIGLLTSEGVAAFEGEYTPSQIASAMAFWMGIYGMVLGFLKLGFLLEFVSLPILSGFISAVAITIILNQMGSLLGEKGIGDGAANQIHDIFALLPKANGYACAIGFTGILFMTVLEKSGARWGKKYRAIWFFSIMRAFLTLVLFTGIGYAVNKDRKSANYLFEVVQVKANGQEPPAMPPADLIPKMATRSIALFVAAAVEHSAIARAFGVKNDYVPDQSQELCYFGVTNFANSFFHSMGVGGAMSRTSVNSQCNVRSPLSGLVTTAVVLVSIFKLVGTLYWIPKATLAAIIITAVWPLIHPPSHFYQYWRTSLADWISSMLAFWISLFVSTEMGIAVSVGFNIVYCVLRQVFARVSASSTPPQSELQLAIEAARGLPADESQLPRDTHIFRFKDNFFFPNSYAMTTAILDSVQTHHAPAYHGEHNPERKERNWSVVAEKRIARLRRRANITDLSALPPLGLVVLDFGRVNHADGTAVSHLKNLKAEILRYGGKGVEIRFVGMTDYVRERFERAGWRVVDPDYVAADDADEANITRHYGTVIAAVLAPRRRSRAPIEGSAMDLMDEKAGVVHAERSSDEEKSSEDKV